MALFGLLLPVVEGRTQDLAADRAKRSHLLPHVADGDGWRSTLLVASVARSASACTLQLHGLSTDRFETAGNVQASDSTATFDLPEAGAYLTWSTRNRSALASGYATLDCTEPVVAQVVFASIGSSGRPSGMATVFSSQAGTEFQFPVLTPEATLGFAIANDTAADAACRIVLEDPQRNPVGEAPLSVPSKTNRAGRLLDQILAIPPTFLSGTATVSCDRPVAAVGLHFELRPDRTVVTFSTLPPAVLEAPDPTQAADETAKRSHLLPHVADGDGWRSTLLVASVARSASACTLQLHGLGTDRFETAGNVQASGSTATFDLPEAGAYLTWSTRNRSALASGYATLDCTEPVVAQVVFASIANSGRPSGMATVFSSQAGTEFQFPVLTPQATLGFAIANDTAADAACRIVLEDPQRNHVGEAPLSVPSKTNRAGRLLDRIIAIPPTFLSGTATVSCDRPVAAVGLHFELRPDRTVTTFSTLPPAVLEAPDLTQTASDREVLEAFYHATGGPGWSNRDNWLSSAPLSEWSGVETDSSDRVTSLSLDGNRLSGAIPAQLGGLASLEELNLQYNRLSGAIPAELGRLANLQGLNLQYNRLSGAIPAELGRLANLQGLYLNDNRLSGAIPPELGRLANLQWLYLSRNQLSGAIPAELGRLANLQGLYLIGNQLSGVIPPELGRLANLAILILSFNPDLTGNMPTELQQLPLWTLELMATAVCVPQDAAFQAWLTSIKDFLPSGAPCGISPDPMPSIDVAVFYTPAARRQAGGKAEVEALIDLMVVETNQAYQDSGADQRIILAAREEVDYAETNGDGFLALDHLSHPTDGHMDEVHGIRDRTGADLVHLIADVTNVGGNALLAGAFGLTCATCDSGTFAHELGHNMGLSHDRYVDRGLLPYSVGYVNQQAFAAGAPESARWKTIMAYGVQCEDADFSCGEILRFSNPDQTWMGDRLGVPGEEWTAAVDGPADAVRALNLTRHSVAAFRPSQNPAPLSSTFSRARPLVRTAPAVAPAPGGGLFRTLAARSARAALGEDGGPLDRSILRRRRVSVDVGRLDRLRDGGDTALALNLFEDVTLTGIVRRRTPTRSGGYALSGPLYGVPGGSVTLVVNGSVVAGTVRLPGAAFRIRPAGGGSHAIDHIDPSQATWRCGTEEVLPH